MTELFCGDCHRFRTWRCDKVWSIGMSAVGYDGNTYWLHYPTDKVPWYCPEFKYYEEVEIPQYLLFHEEELERERRKYGGTVIWS